MKTIYTKNWNRKKEERFELSGSFLKKLFILVGVGTIFLTNQYLDKEVITERGIFMGYRNNRYDRERFYVFEQPGRESLDGGSLEKKTLIVPGGWNILDSFYKAARDSTITGKTYIFEITERGWPFGKSLTAVKPDTID